MSTLNRAAMLVAGVLGSVGGFAFRERTTAPLAKAMSAMETNEGDGNYRSRTGNTTAKIKRMARKAHNQQRHKAAQRKHGGRA